MAGNKTQPTLESVQGFINQVSNSRRKADALVALNIYQEITGLEPIMWGPSIIGFGTRHYSYESGREGTMPTAAFSPRKASMTFYLGDKFENSNALYTKLGKHKKSLACVYINKLDDVDLEVLREIITKDFLRRNQE